MSKVDDKLFLMLIIGIILGGLGFIASLFFEKTIDLPMKTFAFYIGLFCLFFLILIPLAKQTNQTQLNKQEVKK